MVFEHIVTIVYGLFYFGKNFLTEIGKNNTFKVRKGAITLERWPSGRRRTPGTRVSGQLLRGFESPLSATLSGDAFEKRKVIARS